MRKYVIGIDYGTDSCRALVVDSANGREAASAVCPYPRWKKGLYCDARGQRYRQHPLDYTESLETAVRGAVAAIPADRPGEICALAFDTTGSTPVLTDAAGTPLALLPRFAEEPDAMFVLWKDHTAIREAAEINAAARRSDTDYTRYSGEEPFSEPETQAVKALFEKEKFDISAAFHSQGEEIYYDFAGNTKYKRTAEALAKVSGYTAAKPDGIASVTGFKDWVIDKFSLPAFTVEAGKGQNPLPFSQFEKIRKDNYALITECAFLRL